jgi:hypothetical protein
MINISELNGDLRTNIGPNFRNNLWEATTIQNQYGDPEGEIN